MKAHAETSRVNLPVDEDPVRLKAYVHDKQAVASELRGIEHWLNQLKAGELAGKCHELMVKLAEDRFTLAVVGQFKRGKSSLMNAIIGRDLLPTGILPLTSAITILRFGPDERLIITHEDWSFDEEAPVADLPLYVTEKGNAGNKNVSRRCMSSFPLRFFGAGWSLSIRRASAPPLKPIRQRRLNSFPGATWSYS